MACSLFLFRLQANQYCINHLIYFLRYLGSMNMCSGISHRGIASPSCKTSTLIHNHPNYIQVEPTHEGGRTCIFFPLAKLHIPLGENSWCHLTFPPSYGICDSRILAWTSQDFFLMNKHSRVELCIDHNMFFSSKFLRCL